MIKVLFFAHVQDMIGKESILLQEDSITIVELKERLENQYNIQNINTIMFAINEEYANDEDFIQSGDVVALIPPVSGG